ncbi:hypothetical protein, partial [Salmonella sp. SAL4359]|uniref:hypothetical protein n=1 Tax=Salmonella sp. SAL4359 TaxID=3159880 RepID=UPI0039794F66
VSSSRIVRLTQTISSELRQFRELLPSFVNYPEHRGLLTYCDQLEGYLATIEQGQSDFALAPDGLRRQAAGMQRVIG